MLLTVLLLLPLVIPLPTAGVDASQFADPGGYFLMVNGLETYVRAMGPVDGEPVLLLHGFGGSTFSWRETMTPLADAGYFVVAFDRPPYGLSQKTGDLPLTPEAQADFTAGLMDELGIERATLVGHSAGGGVIVYFADRYPDRVDKLVFVAGAVQIAQEHGSGQRAGRTGGFALPPLVRTLTEVTPVNWWTRLALRAFVRPENFTDLQRSAYFDPEAVTPEVADGYQRQLRIEGWDEGLLSILGGGSLGEPLTAEQFEGLTMPALILWGENDTWVPLQVGQTLANLLPNHSLVVYPQVGHLPMEEAPDRFNQDLLAFLNAG